MGSPPWTHGLLILLRVGGHRRPSWSPPSTGPGGLVLLLLKPASLSWRQHREKHQANGRTPGTPTMWERKELLSTEKRPCFPPTKTHWPVSQLKTKNCSAASMRRTCAVEACALPARMLTGAAWAAAAPALPCGRGVLPAHSRLPAWCFEGHLQLRLGCMPDPGLYDTGSGGRSH